MKNYKRVIAASLCICLMGLAQLSLSSVAAYDYGYEDSYMDTYPAVEESSAMTDDSYPSEEEMTMYEDIYSAPEELGAMLDDSYGSTRDSGSTTRGPVEIPAVNSFGGMLASGPLSINLLPGIVMGDMDMDTDDICDEFSAIIGELFARLNAVTVDHGNQSNDVANKHAEMSNIKAQAETVSDGQTDCLGKMSQTTACVGSGVTGEEIARSMTIGLAFGMIRMKKAEMHFLQHDLAKIPDQIDEVDDQLVDLENQLTAACNLAGTYQSYQDIQNIGSQIMNVASTGVGMLEDMMSANQSSYDDIIMRFDHAYTRLKVRLAAFLTAANDVMNANSEGTPLAIETACTRTGVRLPHDGHTEQRNRGRVTECIGTLRAQAAVLP